MMDFNLITNEKLNYCVYAHINKQNGKMYIGITNNPARRWRGNGREYDKSPKLFDAINEFGWDCFDHVVLVDNISKKMASIMEHELIKKYDTINSGYNSSKGSWKANGEDTIKPIYQYDFNGNFIKKWNTTSEASKYFGTQSITALINHSKSCYGYQWSFDYVEQMPPYDIQHNHMYLPIYQYDINGNFIYEWTNQRDAIQQYGMSIRTCAYGQGRTAYGYRWSLEKVNKLSPLPPIEYPKHHIRKKSLFGRHPDAKYKNSPRVCRFDLNGNLIRIYENIMSIDDVDIKMDSVYSLCIKKYQYVYRDSIWVYEKDAYNGYVQQIIERHKQLHPGVIQYDLDGNYIKYYKSIKEAESINGYHNISYVCSGKRQLANGFQWRYENDSPPGKLENYKRRLIRPVIQKSLDGEFIKEHINAKEASIEVGASDNGVNILNVCKGKNKTAYGFLWEFANNEKEV